MKFDWSRTNHVTRNKNCMYHGCIARSGNISDVNRCKLTWRKKNCSLQINYKKGYLQLLLLFFFTQRSSCHKEKGENSFNWKIIKISDSDKGPISKEAKHKHLFSMKCLPWWKQDNQPHFHLLHIACYWYSAVVCLSGKSREKMAGDLVFIEAEV